MKIGIIGGGASGMAAAITASSLGADVTLFEKNERVGKKLLATGNGKCNLSNRHLTADCYHSETPHRIQTILEQWGTEDTLDFFHGLGLMTREKNGGLYPLCEQASAVLDVLRFALYGVRCETGHRVVRAERSGGGFRIHTKKEGGQSSHTFDKIILACGSRAGLKSSDTENGLELAKGLGLAGIPFFPALVQLRCQESCFKALAGVRCQAEVTLEAEGNVWQERGELQLTEYGISGIPVFQLSRHAARALVRGKKSRAILDFLPDTEAQVWKEMLRERMRYAGFQTAEQLFTGTVHKKIANVILKNSHIPPGEALSGISEERLLRAGEQMQCFPVTVTGTNPVSQAQVCGGGIRLTEVTNTLEARKQPGLYVTGELLDADGRCGGYNLQWARAVGVIAGRDAAGGRERTDSRRKPACGRFEEIR